MKLHTVTLASAFVLFAGQAVAQPPVVPNPSFELDDPTLNTNPLGWLQFNASLTVATDQFHSGARSAKLSFGTSNFAGITTNWQDASNPTNPYPYDPVIIYRGDPITISGWYLIPAANALQNGTFTTVKLEFRRTVNNSTYQGFEWPVFGDTGGQWTYFEHTVTAQDFGVFPLEPIAGQPARVSVVPLMFGPNGIDPISAVYWDDLQLTQGPVTPSCYANCDQSSGNPLLTANDFSCFLNQYVTGQSYANCDGVGGLTANDFSCFLSAYVNGCS
jgi:hypothetical protein